MTTPEKHRRPFVGPPQLQFSEKRRGTAAHGTRLGRRSPRLHAAVVQRLDMSAFGAEGRGKRVWLGDGLGGRGHLSSREFVSMLPWFRNERSEDVTLIQRVATLALDFWDHGCGSVEQVAAGCAEEQGAS
jgi:hypothetical protein